MTLVKICGITNIEDAIECVRAGANMLGFVFADSPRRADIQTVKHIIRIIGGDAKTVGVFTEESEDVISVMNDCELTYAQLHGGQSEEFAQTLGQHRVIRAVRIKNEWSLENLAQFKCASYYLLDTYKPGIPGGTGETFDWTLALRAKELGKPVILSGGLGPANVAEAVDVVQPFAVDAASGIEMEPGKKDIGKVKEFVANVYKANHRT
ncbi:MAG: phosphoribosylanthranilate isomerase [Armatimonadetes bacterium]|jgi:phosphoribosylanthranilate isomerase|nr:phosphoribosylanthranilate isomerase [Armatimonadota bacterium]